MTRIKGSRENLKKFFGQDNIMLEIILEKTKNNFLGDCFLEKVSSDLEEKKAKVWHQFYKSEVATVVVLGGGHVGKEIAWLLARLTVQVIVVDDRHEFLNKKDYPKLNCNLILSTYAEVWQNLNIAQSTAIVIATRGHQHDEICLKKALGTKAGYIGMIGSKRKVKIIKESLQKEGFGDIEKRLFAPIGLAIGAQTPAEIAVSIVAEIVMIGRLGINGQLPLWHNMQNFFSQEVGCKFQELLFTAQTFVLAIIINSQGSVPRKKGAMQIWDQQGHSFGTIGGGLAEKKVSELAIEALEHKQSQIINITMDGQTAQDEGMICGGSIEVLLWVVKES